MTHPTFDADGYPTDETLQAIHEWPASLLPSLFTFIREAWRYPDCWRQDGDYGVPAPDVVDLTHRRIEISTGGWSGNEDLIAALRSNQIAWRMCWWSSTRGGHYVFKVPEVAK